MKTLCPKCGELIPPENVNVASDIALCSVCDEAFRISECLDDDEIDAEVLNNPPFGAWYRDDFNSFRIGATRRSAWALICVPFFCVWAYMAIYGIYGSQIVSGQFNLILSLFGIPFAIVSVYLLWAALNLMFGKIEVTVSGTVGCVFMGVGPFGKRILFNWDKVRIIREEAMSVRRPGSNTHGIILDGESRVMFAGDVSDNRRYFLLRGLKYLHHCQSSS